MSQHPAFDRAEYLGLIQVHAARLTSDIEVDLGWRWRHGPEVVLKVQNAKMQARCLPKH